MKLKLSTNTFNKRPNITIPLSDEIVMRSEMQFFDKDGYELNELERLYYACNGANLSEKHLNHTANHETWFYDEYNSQEFCVLDHSYIANRWSYEGEVRAQLEHLSYYKPTLKKLLSIEPKWGIDFSLDFINKDYVMEVFHIEQDFFNLNEAIETKEKAEELILKTDWEDVALEMYKRKDEWEHLPSDDHSDWKAHYVGWNRAFDNKKVFVGVKNV